MRQKKNILRLLSALARYIKSKVKNIYERLVKKEPKKLMMKYITKKS